MAIHCSILNWAIPWTEEPCGLQSRESERVEHNLADQTTSQRETFSIEGCRKELESECRLLQSAVPKILKCHSRPPLDFSYLLLAAPM